MNGFMLTLNKSQELLTKANIYFAPDEVHSLFDYCQHMVKLMTHIIKNH